MRQLAPLFGISESAADRIIDHLGPLMAPQPRRRFARDAVLIVDGTLVPTRDHTIAEHSKNYRYSTNHQVVIDADTRDPTRTEPSRSPTSVPSTTIGSRQQWRGLATRYDKTATIYLAGLHLAAIFIWSAR